MRAIWNLLLLTAIAAILSTNTAHAQLRLRQSREQSVQSQQRPNQKQLLGGQRTRQTKATTTSSTGGDRAIPHIDLAITAIAGGDDALMATVQNQGRSPSPASQLKVVVRDRITGQIRATKFARVAPMEPNRVVRVRLNLLPLGNSRVDATVDPNNQLLEANEQNNTQSATFGTSPVPNDPNQRADLLISGLQAQGNVLLVHVTNVGRARSGAAPVNIVIRRRDGRLQDTKTARAQALEPNGIARMTIRNVVLDDVTVIATVDPENRVPERRENNNTRQVSIANQTQFAPDLTITDMMFKREQKEVWFAVRNVGPVAQNQDVSLTVKSYFGPANVVERSALRVSRINSGQTIWHRWTVGRLNAGMQFEGVLDVSNRLPEQNENNNRRIQTFN